MRLAGLLGDKEGIDTAAFADQGDVGVDALADRFQKGEIGRSGQVPILGVAYHKIENVLASRKLNHSGVPNSGADTHDLIRVVGNMNNRWVRCRRSRRGGGAGLRRRFRCFLCVTVIGVAVSISTAARGMSFMVLPPLVC